MNVVVVESPAKAKTINKYLGPGYTVLASYGHVRDLPSKDGSVKPDDDFAMSWEVDPKSAKRLADIADALKGADGLILATDPDREGEAISWHVLEVLNRKKAVKDAKVQRVVFNAITKTAVTEAMKHPRDIDMELVEAYLARRALDYLVGFTLSPVLWRKLPGARSAGRVQSVALRLVCEREMEIEAFKTQEYWTVEASVAAGTDPFTARLVKLGHKRLSKFDLPDEAAARAARKAVESATLRVASVEKKPAKRSPPPPFTTSTLQQEAARKLGFNAQRTMQAAQRLYEGVDENGGLITYMRTDGIQTAPEAIAETRKVIAERFGASYVPESGRIYKSKAKNAQEAHEAIRPTSLARHPSSLRLEGDLARLYELIWRRMVASQMESARIERTSVDIDTPDGSLGLRATGQVVQFDGYLAVYEEGRDDAEDEDSARLPAIKEGADVNMLSAKADQHFTEPPPRFSEASLVKELERLGIGRPSTYASIISTLVDRRYVLLEQRRFTPTSLGESVERVMVKQFPDIFNVGFTSEMEGELDKIEEGELPWRRVLKDFYGPFETSLQDVDVGGLIAEAHDLSSLAKDKCPKCGGALVPKGGFFGPFVACENHPKNCDFTRPVSGEKKPAVVTDYMCHECGAPMVIRHGRSGDFLGCSKFPKCRGTRSMPTGVMCPKDGGELAQRRSKARGKTFFGCENYPKCEFVCWDRPVKDTCPECGYVGAEAKANKTRGEFRKCLKCANEWDVVPAEEPAAVG